MRYQEARIDGHLLVLYEGEGDQETTAVGGVPLSRIAAWRTDYMTSQTSFQVEAAYQITVDHRWRDDHGQTMVDLDDALRAYFRRDPLTET